MEKDFKMKRYYKMGEKVKVRPIRYVADMLCAGELEVCDMSIYKKGEDTSPILPEMMLNKEENATIDEVFEKGYNIIFEDEELNMEMQGCDWPYWMLEPAWDEKDKEVSEAIEDLLDNVKIAEASKVVLDKESYDELKEYLEWVRDEFLENLDDYDAGCVSVATKALDILKKANKSVILIKKD